VTQSREELLRLLDEAASSEHLNIAKALDALRENLGRDGLSVEEWNALVGSAFFHRAEASRRQNTRAIARDSTTLSGEE
jgi:hypothetical protein